MAQGTVKGFDIEARTGVILLDDRTEVLIEATSIEGSEVRYLRLGQRVDFEIAEEGGRKVARKLHIVTFAT